MAQASGPAWMKKWAKQIIAMLKSDDLAGLTLLLRWEVPSLFEDPFTAEETEKEDA
jgi:hypothetical protein